MLPSPNSLVSTNCNTVYLGAQDPDLRGRWSWRIAVLRALHDEVRHLALHRAGVIPAATFWEYFEEQFGSRLAVGVVDDVRGKNPGGKPRFCGPPGASE